MDALKTRIIQRLDLLPTVALEQVLSFIEFLLWRQKPQVSTSNTQTTVVSSLQEEDLQWLESDLSNLEAYDTYEWQPGELENGTPVEVDFDQGTVTIYEQA
jgi:hypothetical protein